MKAYLAGSVELVGMTYARSWREQAKELMRDFTNVIPVDPLDYEDRDGPWNDEQIVNTDRHLIRNCDVMLVDGRQPGWGTGFECAWAHDLSIPIVVWGKSREDASTFLRYHAVSFHKTLQEAILEGVAPLGLPNV